MDADEVADLITFIPSYGRERIRAFLQRLREEAGCLGGHRAEVRGGHQQISATKSVKSRLGLSLPVRRKRRASDGASALLYEHNLPNP
jgi:hypothetical protein